MGFFVRTLGLSSWDTPFESGSSNWSGFGLSGGVGYEFSPHWSVQGLLLWGIPSESEVGFKVTSNAVAFGVVITGVAY